MSTLLNKLRSKWANRTPFGAHRARNRFGVSDRGDAYVGEVFSIGYDEALVQIHDFNRQQVAASPHYHFCLQRGSRQIPLQTLGKKTPPWCCFASWIHADLPNAQEALRVRVENRTAVSGELEKTFRPQGCDGSHDEQLARLRGRSVSRSGTFYADLVDNVGGSKYELMFGSDLSKLTRSWP